MNLKPARHDPVIELARPLHEVNPRDADVLSLLAEAHVALGQEAEGRAYLRQLVSVPLKWNYLPYFAGRTFEMLGDRESALRYIRESLQNGYDPVTLERDPWLDDLRADPGYRAILDSIGEVPLPR